MNTPANNTRRNRARPIWIVIIVLGAASRIVMMYAEEPPRLSTMLAAFVEDHDARPITAPQRVVGGFDAERRASLVGGGYDTTPYWSAPGEHSYPDRSFDADRPLARRVHPAGTAQTRFAPSRESR